MLGFYDYTVVLTYISLGFSIVGMTRALEGDFRVAILCLALSGLCDMFDGRSPVPRRIVQKMRRDSGSDRFLVCGCLFEFFPL